MTVLSLFASFAPAVTGQSAEDEVAIQKVVDKMYAALNRQDVKAGFALCDESFENYAGTLKGRDANEKYWSKIFTTRFKNVKYKQIEKIGIQFITSDVAIYKDRYNFSGALDEEGKPRPASKWSNAHVFVKKGGKWMYATMIQWAQ
jgi:hypothetical protein